MSCVQSARNVLMQLGLILVVLKRIYHGAPRPFYFCLPRHIKTTTQHCKERSRWQRYTISQRVAIVMVRSTFPIPTVVRHVLQ